MYACMFSQNGRVKHHPKDGRVGREELCLCNELILQAVDYSASPEVHENKGAKKISYKKTLAITHRNFIQSERHTVSLP